MCSNPFGGFDRLDRIDLFHYASGSDDPHRLLFLSVIQQASQDYLFYGLGKNGLLAEEFWFATEYFFNVRSDDTNTLDRSRFTRLAYQDEDTGERISQNLMLSDEELALGCFDQHYVLAGLDLVMPIDRFLAKLKDQRLKILIDNWNQVRDYLAVPADDHSLLCALVEPNEPEQLIEVLYAADNRTASMAA